jgi:hypothetical protein
MTLTEAFADLQDPHNSMSISIQYAVCAADAKRLIAFLTIAISYLAWRYERKFEPVTTFTYVRNCPAGGGATAPPCR